MVKSEFGQVSIKAKLPETFSIVRNNFQFPVKLPQSQSDIYNLGDKAATIGGGIV